MIGARVGVKCGVMGGARVGVGTDQISPQSSRNLILFWGQSNAAGEDDYANITNANGYVNNYTPVQLSQWVTSSFSDPPVYQVAGTRAAAAPRAPSGQVNFGPELSMARHLNRVQPGKWAIAKWGMYGAGLEAAFLPSANYPAGANPNLFHQMMNDAAAQASANNATVRALVWIQGETDALTSTPAADYAANLATFINAVRAVYPSLPVIIARICSAQTMTFTTTVYNAQTNWVAGDAHATLVNTDDLTPLISTYHYSANNIVTLGNRLATAVLGQLGIPDVYPSAAWTLDADGQGIPLSASEWAAVLSTANITSGNPFRASDCTVASGNLTDMIGSVPLVASGTGVTYQSTAAGWTRTGWLTADAGTGAFTTTDATSLPDVSTTSMMTLTYVRTNVWPGTFRNFTTLGTTVQSKLSSKNTGFFDYFDGNTNNTVGTAKPAGAVRPYLIQRNKTAGTVTFMSDQETFTVPMDNTVTGKKLILGTNGNGTPNAITLYEASWKGAAAEMTPAQMKQMLTTLGWIMQF